MTVNLALDNEEGLEQIIKDNISTSQVKNLTENSEALNWMTQNYFTRLSNQGFKISDIALILTRSEGIKRGEYLANHYTSVLKERGFSCIDAIRIIKNEGWRNKLVWAISHYEKGFKPLGFTNAQAAQLISGPEWREKLDSILRNYSKLKQFGLDSDKITNLAKSIEWKKQLKLVIEDYEDHFEPLGYNVPQVMELIRIKNTEERMGYIQKNHSRLEQCGFNSSTIVEIIRGEEWQEKLEWAAEGYEKEFKPLGFTNSQAVQVIRTNGWKEKIQWVINDYQKVLQPFGFTPDQISRILRGKEWQSKIKLIVSGYEDFFKPAGIECDHLAKILRNSDWSEKIDWLLTEFPTYQKHGLTGYKTSMILSSSDWKEQTKKLEENKVVLDYLNYEEDEDIDPLAEKCLKELYFEGVNGTRLLKLKTKCTQEQVEKFKDDVYQIAGIEEAKTAGKVISELHKWFNYSEEEVRVYTAALGKTMIGLRAWYNTGTFSSKLNGQHFIPLVPESMKNSEDKVRRIRPGVSTEDLYFRKEGLFSFLSEISFHLPEYSSTFETLVWDCNSDPKQLSVREKRKLAQGIKAIRTNPELAEQLYDCLKI